MAGESGGASEPEFVRHAPPIELSRTISVTFPPPSGGSGTIPTSGLLKLHLTAFDVFGKADFGRVSDDLSKRIGASETRTGYWGQRPTKVTSWKVDDRSVLVAGANATLLGGLGQHDPHTLDQGIDSAMVLAWDIDGFPFVILALVVRCDAAHWSAKSPDLLGSELRSITYPLRRFVDGLGGVNSAGGTMSPRSPLVTWAPVAVDQAMFDDVIHRSQIKPRTPLLWEPHDPKFFHDIPVNPPVGFPYRLEEDFRSIQRRSMLQLSGNTAALFGLSAQLGLAGDYCPYVLFLTSDSSLFEDRIPLPLDGPSIPNPHESFHQFGAWSLVTIVCLRIWLDSLRKILTDSELAASSSRQFLRSEKGSVTQGSLRKVLDANLASADVLADLGSMRRVFLESLILLHKGRFGASNELPSAPNGILSHLAEATLSDIHDLEERFSGLTRECATLAGLVASDVSLQSTKRLEVLTGQIATQSRTANALTIALICLTTVIGALTVYLYLVLR